MSLDPIISIVSFIIWSIKNSFASFYFFESGKSGLSLFSGIVYLVEFHLKLTELTIELFHISTVHISALHTRVSTIFCYCLPHSHFTAYLCSRILYTFSSMLAWWKLLIACSISTTLVVRNKGSNNQSKCMYGILVSCRLVLHTLEIYSVMLLLKFS